MPKLYDAEAQRLFKAFDDAGYVQWPLTSADPIVLTKNIAHIIGARGQARIKPGRIADILYEPHYANRMYAWEARAIADALGIDVRALHYDAPPKLKKPASLLDELQS